MNKFYSRKFTLAMLSLISANALVWFGKIDPGVFLQLVVATVGSYMLANYAEKKVEVSKPVDPNAPAALG
jgi:hypothetical protein